VAVPVALAVPAAVEKQKQQVSPAGVGARVTPYLSTVAGLAAGGGFLFFDSAGARGRRSARGWRSTNASWWWAVGRRAFSRPLRRRKRCRLKECAGTGGGGTVTLYEATAHLLAKVRISGGGRCNVTHACFEPRELVKNIRAAGGS